MFQAYCRTRYNFKIGGVFILLDIHQNVEYLAGFEGEIDLKIIVDPHTNLVVMVLS